MSSSSVNFSQVVDDAIAKRGYRISSRKPLEYRLRRYIELYNAELGDERLTSEELDAVAGILMLTDNAAAMAFDNARRANGVNGRITFHVNSDNTHSRTFSEGGGHSMVRRSQVTNSGCCDSTRSTCSNTVESVMAVSCRSSVRPARTHPMSLRANSNSTHPMRLRSSH